MTHAPTQDARQPTAFLSRVLVLLALVLFGLPQGHADGIAGTSGVVVQDKVEQAEGILSVQRHSLRGENQSDDPLEATSLEAAALTAHPIPAKIPAALHPAPNPAAIRILPPVRGPPAA